MSEEEQDADFPEDDLPAAQEPASPGFRFSISRLAAAIVAATLPLLLIADWNRQYGWVFCISSLAIAGVALRIRATDLPRLNVALQLLLPCTALSGCSVCFGLVIFPLICGAASAFALAYLIFPRESGDSYEPLSTLFLWLSGILPFFLLCMVTLLLSFARRSEAPITSDRYAAILLLPATFGLLTLINLYWFATDRDDPLDDDPPRAYLYELTLVILPVATLCGLWNRL